MNNRKIDYTRILAKIIYSGMILFFAYIFITKGLVGYESNDDAFLGTIPSGWFGFFSPYTIHNNIIQGKVLALLSSVLQTHNWTVWYYLVLIIVSFLLFGIWCIDRHGTLLGGIFSVLFVLFCWVSLICRMNYSKSGAVALSVGCVIFLDSIDTDSFTDKRKKVFRIVGTLLAIIGALARYKVDLSVLPFFILGAVFVCMKYGIKSKQTVYIGALLTTILLLWGIDYGVYHFDSKWNDFKKFNDIREQLLDYDIPSYENDREIYNQLGLSENDYLMLTQWNYADDTVFTYDVMKSLVDYRDSHKDKISFDTVNGVIKGFKNLVLQYGQINIVLFVFILFISLGKTDNAGALYVSLLMFLGELCYLIWVGRPLERAVMIPVISELLLLILLFDSRCVVKKKTCISICIAIVIYAYSVCGFSTIKDIARREGDGEHNKVFAYLSEQEDNLYIWQISDMCGAFSNFGYPFEKYVFGIGKNSVPMGAWFIPAPFIQEIEEPFGESNNVFKILVDNSNAYYVGYAGADTEILETYLREHYYPNAEFEMVDTFEQYGIYSVR